MNQEYDPADSAQQEVEEQYELSVEDANNEWWDRPVSIISLDEAMEGFTNGDLELLRGMRTSEVWTEFLKGGGPDDPTPSFTIWDLARWMDEHGL